MMFHFGVEYGIIILALKVRTFGASSIDDAITAIAHKITLERHIVLQFLLILIYD